MKHNIPNCCIYLINMKKFIFSDLRVMRWALGILCCIMIIPVTAYAQSETDTLQIEQEQYILKRTGDVLVKVFGSVDDVYASVSLTHTTPEGESITHKVRITDQGFYTFYFSHNWKSIRGDYDVFVSKNDVPIGTVIYELVQDPTYKTDEEVKEEYFIKADDSDTISTIIEDRPDFLLIEAEAVEGSKIITITGKATSNTIPVIITVLSPNGNVVSIDQISPETSGSFTSTINVGGPMWKQDGIYSITAQQGTDYKDKSSVEIEIIDGAVIPEFGTIASLILVVAISSIVALSAKSRLRFQVG